jgi:electron transport complex protein RnfC
MSVTQERLRQTEQTELSVTLRNAGVAGAGGAGFPSYAKWNRIGDVDHLLVNHQESEPNYYIDKWLGREHAEELATLFDVLLERSIVESVVVAAKEKDRGKWLGELEDEIGGSVHEPADMPLSSESLSSVSFAYTADEYNYGMENVLLKKVGDVVVGNDLPMDHGWLVQNTETMYNIYRALEADEPVTRTYVHVDGQTPRHRFLEVPIGTPASALVTAADRPPADFDVDTVLLDGGPGWCFEIDADSDEFGVRKRTNCVIVTDETTRDANELGSGRVDIRDQRRWRDSVDETEPSATIEPEFVRIPLISNPSFEGVVQPSEPIVEPGDEVSRGEMVARPAGEVSNAQHASIDGVVTEVSDTHVEIHCDPGEVGVESRGAGGTEDIIYWTWCVECGTYVVHPETADQPKPTQYVCEDCRPP